MENKELLVYDVCGTLTYSNNTKDFIFFVIKEDLLKNILFNILLFFSNYFLKIVTARSLDVFLRKIQISFLKNYPKAYIDKKSNEYLDWLIKENKFRTDILNKLQLNKNKEIILVSAAISPPIRAIANYLGVKFYSTELEYKNNICTGKIKKDLYFNKQSLFKDKKINLHSYVYSIIFSDNLEDELFFNYFDEVNFLVSKNGNYFKKIKGSLNILFKEEKVNLDINSINKQNIKMVYVPFVYYLLSRLHSRGLVETFFKQVLPYSIIFSILLKMNIFSATLFNFYIIFWFYSIYEIGSFFNDLNSRFEKSKNSIHRVESGLIINKKLFIITRVLISFFFICVAIIFNCFVINSILFFIILLFTILIHIIHTKITPEFKIFTFGLLRFLRSAAPFIFLLNFIDVFLLFQLMITFFILFSANGIYNYYYLKQNGFIKNNENLISVLSYFFIVLLFLISKELILILLLAYFVSIKFFNHFFNI